MLTPRQRNILRGQPIKDPELNFDLYADQLCKIAIKATAIPENAPPDSERSRTERVGAFTVGIFGSWGSGKTTLMGCIKDKFENENFLQSLPEELKLHKCKTIWFNAWKYDGKEDIKNALIQTILREMLKESKNEVVRKKVGSLAANAACCLGGVLGQVAKGGINVATTALGYAVNVKDIAEEIEKILLNNINNGSDPYQFVNNFEDKFEETVNFFLEEKGYSKLIVFIDDLDRCLPENALAVLESIKLYLDQANCVFYIGLDKRIIEQAVGQRYPKYLGISGKEYIEKIIRLNFFLPDKDGDEVRKRLIEGGLTGSYSHDEEMWKMIYKATECNVRKVQQFIIAFYLVEEIVKALNEKLEHQVERMLRQTPRPQDQINQLNNQKINWQTKYPKLGKVLLIQLNFPQFYDALAKNYQLMKQIKDALETEGGFENLIAAQDKYPGFNKFFVDRSLIDFVVDHFAHGEIGSAEDWKEIQQLSKAVTY